MILKNMAFGDICLSGNVEMIDFNPTPFIVLSSQQSLFFFLFGFLLNPFFKLSTNNDSARRMFQCTPECFRGKMTLSMTRHHNLRFFVRAHAPLLYAKICTYHME